MPSTTSATTGDPADDPLCQLNDERVKALDGHLPVENSEDLMAVSEAQLAYYTQATEVLDPPERDAFAEFAEYETEKVAYHEEVDWDPSPGIDYALENLPSPPSDDALHVIKEVLQQRCGIEPVEDTPAQ